MTEIEPGKKIATVKALSLAEEYLGDHFPDFPVLPGVMMIEALVQSAAMLVRVTNHFRHSMVVMSECRNVKYKSFVKPGNLLRIQIDAKSIDDQESSFTGQGWVDDRSMVEARFKLKHYNLCEQEPYLADVDNRIIQEMKKRAALVGACR